MATLPRLNVVLESMSVDELLETYVTPSDGCIPKVVRLNILLNFQADSDCPAASVYAAPAA